MTATVEVPAASAADLAALDRLLHAELDGLRQMTDEAKRQAEHAIEVAASEASDRLSAHNGLIEQMRAQAEKFATRESADTFRETTERRFGASERFQAKLTGGLLLLSVIGIANLVKVWT